MLKNLSLKKKLFALVAIALALFLVANVVSFAFVNQVQTVNSELSRLWLPGMAQAQEPMLKKLSKNNVTAQTAESEDLIGLTNGIPDSGYGYPKDMELAAGVELSPEYLQPHVGKQVKMIRFFVSMPLTDKADPHSREAHTRGSRTWRRIRASGEVASPSSSSQPVTIFPSCSR